MNLDQLPDKKYTKANLKPKKMSFTGSSINKDKRIERLEAENKILKFQIQRLNQQSIKQNKEFHSIKFVNDKLLARIRDLE